MSDPRIATISVVFNHAEFEDVFQTCIDGLLAVAKILACHHLEDVLDDLVVSLSHHLEDVLGHLEDVLRKNQFWPLEMTSTSLVFFQFELLVMQLMILSFLLNQFDSNKRDFNFTVGMFGSNRHYPNTVSYVLEKAIIVAKVEPLVKDFASRWKAAVELMHGLQLRG
uniref:ARF guanine-nucleotide exchange factor GNOM n=1 Tax=Tanacetum cinerariifolium TaxID=118510 RepID=A0A699JNI6_TANCI|nr:ARF guanine-nucleotide exchange factor GNOM [Tanacetum cinerariifolium]